MTTDGMKRRDFLRTVTTLVGAVALGGSASLLSGCGGNGGSGGGTPVGPTLSVPTAPAGVPASTVASVLTNAGVSGISSASVGNTINTLSSTTSSAAATEAATDLSAAVSNLPASAPLGIVTNGSVQTISVSAFQAQIGSILAQIAALPAGEGPTLGAGDEVKIITYTLANGQQISSPAIVTANGAVLFDTTSFLAFPAPTDSSHFITQNAQVGAAGAGATTMFNPVSGLFQFRDVVTGDANSEANGNLSATNPVTNLKSGTPTTGPGVTAGTGTVGTPVFKSVAVNSAAKTRQSGGSFCVTITVSFTVQITLFGITLTVTVTVSLTLCSTTSGAGGGGI